MHHVFLPIPNGGNLNQKDGVDGEVKKPDASPCINKDQACINYLYVTTKLLNYDWQC